MDLVAERQNSLAEHNPDFQLDVIAIRAYRLFAFSCTTEADNRAIIKHKLFEAYMRARQLGGDEARVAMVACCNQKIAAELQVEAMRDLDALGGKIRVFGLDCFSDLVEHIKNWVEELEDPSI